ncbi:winged helix-turn-helix transcriptional regulator [Catellatospora paridis]|uniref:winged helix-turn-helix transcriptional regulator n=1 Tax=Catellatospora paridis TaxID=1617086 RepID=UPI0012D44887|nr:winged helix-turn-helix transcriptional regulator [Catellatospora paridis]
MPKRLYGQLCPIARSLDVLGERWTLLIVRELLLGPRRFKELLTLLPAMGTNRLAERLQLLERSGVVVRRALPAASDVRAYELTAYGERLRPLLIELATWGNELPIDDEIDPGTARAELIALYLAEQCPPQAGRGRPETYRFQVGDEVFHVTVDDAGVHARSGPGPVAADLVVTCDLTTFDALTRGEFGPAEAVASGVLTADGDSGALTRAFEILRYRTPAATAA